MGRNADPAACRDWTSASGARKPRTIAVRAYCAHEHSSRAGRRTAVAAALCLLLTLSLSHPVTGSFTLLDPADYRQHYTGLPTVGGISADAAAAWAEEQLPFIDLPQAETDLLAAYYYRTKVLREHILETGYPDAPWAVSECKFSTTQLNESSGQPLNGTVGCSWGDAYGVINAASGHVIAEGSWLRSSKYMNSYLSYFFKGAHKADGSKANTYGARTYTSWQTFAALKKLKNDGNISIIASLLPAFVASFKGWVQTHRLDRCPGGACHCVGADVSPSGKNWWQTCPDNGKPPCFWTDDGWDAMEGSLSGTGCRPSINAIAYGEAAATAELAGAIAAAAEDSLPRLANGSLVISAVEAAALSREFRAVAADIRKLYLSLLWHDKLQHFAVWKTNASSHGDGRLAATNHGDHGDHPPLDPREKWSCGSPFLSYWGFRDIHEQGNCSSNHWLCDSLAEVRELFALSTPWYFGLVPATESPKYEVGMQLLLDGENGYGAPWGMRTAALNARGMCSSWDHGNSSSWNDGSRSDVANCPCYNHTHGECSWDGPVWPYETARTLSAVANLLQPGEQYTDAQRRASGLTPADFQALLTTYAKSMTRGSVAGTRKPPYVGENIHPDDGYWIARQQMFWGGSFSTSPEDPPMTWPTGPPMPDRERSVDYMHSTFVDNVLGGLLGLRGQLNESIVVSPLVNASKMTHFAIDNLLYHGKELAVSWDPTGSRYKPKRDFKGCAGLCVYVDGQPVAQRNDLGPLRAELAAAVAPQLQAAVRPSKK